MCSAVAWARPPFFDAAAPSWTCESIDRGVLFLHSRVRYEDAGAGDYLNCPMDRASMIVSMTSYWCQAVRS